MRIALGRRLRFPVFGNVVSRGASGKKGTPPNVNAAPDGPDLCYGKLAEPLRTAGGGRPGKRTGHHSAVQMKSLFANKLLRRTVVNSTAALNDEMVALSSSG